MSELRNLETSLRGELLHLHNELKGFHLRVITLQKDNRSNQSEIQSLNVELTERKANEKKLEATVTILTEESGELKEKLGRLEEHVMKMNNEGVGQDLPTPPPGPSITDPDPFLLSQGTGHNVLEMLNTLSTEIQSKFGDWNGKQVNLQKEVENLKQVIKDLGASPHPPPHSTTNVKEEMRPGSPSLLADINGQLDEFDDYVDDDIQILSPPTMHTSPSTPDLPPAPPSPPPDNNVEDAYAFVETELDDEVPGFSGNLLRNPSPAPGPSTRLEPIPNQNQNPLPTPTKKVRGPRKFRDRRWSLPHGKDNSNPSGLLCLCGTTLKTRHGFIQHLQYFTEEWRFRCELCQNRRFAKLGKLREHVKRVHNCISVGERFGCHNCGVILASRMEHRRHLRLCANKLTATRIKISNVTGAASNAATTSANNVGSAPSITPPSTSTGPCYAPASKKVTPIKISIPLNPNRNNPTVIKKLNLTRIKKEFTGPVEPSSLHRRDPTREYACICGVSFRNNGGLTRHVKYHTAQKFRCRPCGRWFALQKSPCFKVSSTSGECWWWQPIKPVAVLESN